MASVWQLEEKDVRAHKSSGRKIWGVFEEDFVVLDIKEPTARKEELLQLSDQALKMIYEALDNKVFERIKDLDYAYHVW